MILNVKSSVELKILCYVVVGRTGIVKTECPEYEGKYHEADIEFTITTWMLPEAQILIYYIHHTGEVIYDHTTISFDNSLPNTVKY